MVPDIDLAVPKCIYHHNYLAVFNINCLHNMVPPIDTTAINFLPPNIVLHINNSVTDILPGIIIRNLVIIFHSFNRFDFTHFNNYCISSLAYLYFIIKYPHQYFLPQSDSEYSIFHSSAFS